MGGAVAVTAILTRHQGRMAELMRRDREEAHNNAAKAEIDALRQELQELRDRVNQRAIEQDDRPPTLPPKN